MPPPAPGLTRRLSLLDATLIVLSGVIGSGIFINPAVVAQSMKTPPLMLAVWAAGGLIALGGAFLFAELGSVLPRAGGQYAFCREAYHPLLAFLYGWALLLIIMSGAAAAVAVAFAEYVARLVGLPARVVSPLAAAMLILLSGFHALGVKPGAVLINIVTLVKTLALAALVVGAFALGTGAAAAPAPAVPTGPSLVSAFLAALIPALFAYGGWQNLSCVAEEVRDPERTLPRAILLGMACVIVIYLGANLAYVHALGAGGLAATRTPAADVAARIAGERGARLISLLIAVSTFGFMNLALLAAPRVYYAMAADRLFFRSLARVHPRTHVPVRAILLQGALAAALALTSSYEQLLGYAVFADWVFLTLSAIALIILRRRLPHAPRPYPAPLYPVLPVAFALLGVAILGNAFVADRRSALLASVILLGGVPAYFLFKRSR